MRPALIALAVLLLAVTGVALATPVPVLSVTEGSRELVRYFPDGDTLTYSYRHSIYDAEVSEEFRRAGDELDFVRVRASDIRAIEYLRWDSPIRSEGQYFVSEPPSSPSAPLVIRVTRGAEQRLRASGWSFFLFERFGDAVVRLRVERPAVLLALVRGVAW